MKLMKLEKIRINDNEFLWEVDYLRTPQGESIRVKSIHLRDFVILEDETQKFHLLLETKRIQEIPNTLLPNLENFGFVENVCFTVEVILEDNGKIQNLYLYDLKKLKRLRSTYVLIKPLISKTLKREVFSEDSIWSFMLSSLKLHSIFDTLFSFPTGMYPYNPIRNKNELFSIHEELLVQALNIDQVERCIKELRSLYSKASFEECVNSFKRDCLKYLYRDEDGTLYSLCLSTYTDAVKALERLRLGRIKTKAYRHAWIEIEGEKYDGK